MKALPSSSTAPAPDKSGGKDLAVEEWAKGMLAIPATPARSRTLQVPAVLCQAYTLGDDRLGILLVNLRGGAEETVRLPIEPKSYGLTAGRYELQTAGTIGRSSLGEFAGRRELELKLPPRAVVLVSATRIRGWKG